MAQKYPAVFILIATVAGIILSDYAAIPSWVYLILAIAILPISIVIYFSRKKIPVGLFIMLLMALLSAFGYSFRYKTFPPDHVIHRTDDYQKYKIFGTVSDWPIIREHRTSIYLAVDSLSLNSQTHRAEGRILVYIGSETTKFQYGDRLQFEAQLFSIKGGKNPTGMDYRRYLNLKEVFATAYLPNQYQVLVDPAGAGYYMRIIDRLRQAIIDTFKSTLSPDAAALASGFLIGETRDIPVNIYRLFRDSGTLHLLAVSGSNVALVLVVFIFLMKASPLSVRGRTIILIGVVVVFTLLSYNQPSVVRASIMATLVLLGRLFQRKINLNNIIATTALLILIVKPTEFYDVGFQLSFTTAWGLIYLTPKIVDLMRPIHDKPYYKYVIFPVIISLVAQLSALPMSAFYFGRFPLIATVSNLVIVPLVSLIVVGEMVVLFGALILPTLGLFFGSLLNPLLNLNIHLLYIFGTKQTAMVQAVDISVFTLICYYLILITAVHALYLPKARRILIFIILVAANIFIFIGLLKSDSGKNITIFSGSGGIIALSELEPNQLIISDLPLKDYYLTEKIVIPYIMNKNLDNISLIVLSDNYQSIKEAAYLYRSKICPKLYLPVSSKNIMTDLCNIKISDKSPEIFYYENNNPSDSLFQNRISLSDQNLLYHLDSLTLLFVRESQPIPNLSSVDSVSTPINIIIKSEFSADDLNRVRWDQIPVSTYFICNRLPKISREQISENSADFSLSQRILETSKVGAVQIVIDNGRFRELKCSNYGSF